MVGGEGRCGWLAMTSLGGLVGAEGLPTGRAAEDPTQRPKVIRSTGTINASDGYKLMRQGLLWLAVVLRGVECAGQPVFVVLVSRLCFVGVR